MHYMFSYYQQISTVFKGHRLYFLSNEVLNHASQKIVAGGVVALAAVETVAILTPSVIGYIIIIAVHSWTKTSLKACYIARLIAFCFQSPPAFLSKSSHHLIMYALQDTLTLTVIVSAVRLLLFNLPTFRAMFVT